MLSCIAPAHPGRMLGLGLVASQAQPDGPEKKAGRTRAAVKKGSLVEIEAAGHMPMMEAPRVTAEALKGLSR
jgi:pimeloyl-ACP methyl ester carboxylesterase